MGTGVEGTGRTGSPEGRITVGGRLVGSTSTGRSILEIVAVSAGLAVCGIGTVEAVGHRAERGTGTVAETVTG